MKTLLASAVALLLLGTSIQTGRSSEPLTEPLPPLDPSVELFSFSRLPTGHTIVVEYETWSCFYHKRTEFQFDGGSPMMAMASVVGKGMGDYIIPLGLIALSAEDARGLDSLMSCYQLRKGSGCSMDNTIRMEHWFEGRILASRKFHHVVCRPFKGKGILSLGEILWRFRKK